MAGELICFDDKHISVEQMQMSVDRILQYYIRNMTGPPLPLIEDYLREAGFWHVAMIGRGCKLDPKLIITRSIHSADWGAPNDDSTELEKIRYARAYILQIIGGYLMLDLSRNLVQRWLLKLVDFRAAGEFSWGSVVLATLYREMCGATRPNKAKIGGCLSLLQSWARFRFPFLRPRVDHPYTFPLITRWNHSASYARLPTCLEDIRLLLEQRSKAQFQWTPYDDPAIQTVIPDEYLQNPNTWHVKVLDDHHKIDLRQLHTDWPRFWSHYIQIWEDRYDYISTREPIIVPELACVPEYMPWFRIHAKPYLLSEEERQRQLHAQRERRGPLNPRRRDDDAGSSTAPTQSPGPGTRPIQSPGPTVQPSTPTTQPLQMMLAVARGIAGGAIEELFFLPIPITLWVSNTSAINDANTSTVTFYQGGSSSQHPQLESSPEQAEPPPEAGQRRNPTRNRRRPPCGTESDRYGH
ncbi:hypothetical protein CXB51_011762 [Gossypium anomalum]|uniref:Aminotransferase-like plant mobile domain-containing protein n=1 Tax=Gossypium anomalum TaxID=47600 RepID=A0A8J5YVA1_9ROSI|nr:hypothetical protein CXB51_011762 [Gossypium anomalum]